MPGRETEGKAMDALQYYGFSVYQPPKAKFREQDVFGLYDLLAFGNGQLLGIQVKGGRDAAGVGQWFDRAALHGETLRDFRIQFWHRKDDCWRIAEPAADGYEWVFDGRRPEQTRYSRLADVL